MSIKIIASGKSLTAAVNDAVYQAPGDVISATVATGTVENTSPIGVRLWIRVSGRDLMVLNGRTIPAIGGPLVLPAISMRPGEELQAWAETGNTLHLNMMIGEQR